MPAKASRTVLYGLMISPSGRLRKGAAHDLSSTPDTSWTPGISATCVSAVCSLSGHRAAAHQTHSMWPRSKYWPVPFRRR